MRLPEGGTVVVTGVTGFVGKHVALEAAARGFRVHGIARTGSDDPELLDSLAALSVVDLRHGLPDDLPVDGVLHLAGLASVGPSFEHPQTYIAENSAMMTVLGERLLRDGSRARVVVVSSGAVYAAASGRPVTESTALRASSPYAVSKIVVEVQAQYYRDRGLDVVVARPFNHIGSGQRPGFLVPDLLDALSASPGEVAVGDLATRRDYTDVRDIARAYMDLLQAETLAHDTYNVASGRSRSGEEVLARICAELGRPVPRREAKRALSRPADVADVVGSHDRITDELGWRPTTPFEQTIAEIVKAERE
ncbi:NAD-dependent epimerase/dehydratase family protein [Microbacterium sp. NPDC089321]|uniref:NAD-dependent epimerase/dehydratase family protein n=1 Tax=Microbacterium sp. NPDC089321 TaxID=3155183 RepID=UPI003431EE60